ncbi:RNA 2',3'-cyclic phosphodiesterase, partial [Dysosmobacter welbionis]
GQDLQAAHVLGGGQELPGLAQGRLGLELLQLMAQLLHLRCLLLRLGGQLTRCCLQHLSGVEQQLLIPVHGVQAQSAHRGLDPADARGDGALGLDAEGTGLGGVVQMGAAAELHGEVAHLHHADDIAVLLTEHGHGALLFGLLDGQHLRRYGVALQDGVVHQLVDLSQ